MNRVFTMTTGDLTPSVVDFIKNNYPNRYKKALSFNDKNDTDLCLCVARLLSEAGINEQEVVEGENGKPYLKNGGYISISHSGKYCVLACFDVPVGIDIEPIGRVTSAVAKRFFTKKEQAWAGDDELKLTVLWTYKEALSKLDGDGIKMLLSGADVLAFVTGKAIISDNKKITAELQFLGDYVLAITTKVQ